MKQTLNVLIIDDDSDDVFITTSYLKAIDRFDITIDSVSSFEEGLALIKQKAHNIYFVDYRLGARTGVDLIRTAIESGNLNPYILLTGIHDRQSDRDATEAGAYDYLVKGEMNSDLLERSIRYAKERYNAYMAVKKSEERYFDIINKISDVLFVVDEKLCFVNVNKAMCSVLGYTPEEVIGHPITSLFHYKDEALLFYDYISSVEKNGNIEIRLQSAQGDVHTFIAVFSKLPIDENREGYQGILYDFVHIKKSFADFLIKEKTDSINRLVRTLAHEIRNPLTNIDLSVSNLEPELSKDDLYYADIIKRNSKRINNLLKELVGLSSPADIQPTEIGIADLIDDALSSAIDRINLKKITLVKNYQGAQQVITVDIEKMKIALLNLVINAVEAIEGADGKIEISVKELANTVHITIADNGKGIDTENLSKLFQPNFTSKKNGLGLGLANTRAIIMSHSGHIDFVSEKGKGTTFVIKLPANLNKTQHKPDTQFL